MTETGVVTYQITDAAIAEMESLYMGLTISDLEDREEFDAVHSARMVVKTHRVAVEKKRKELKADALAWGKKVDSEAKRIFGKLEPIEDHLMAEENKVLEAEKRRKEEEDRIEREKIQARVNALQSVNVVKSFVDVAMLSDDDFTALIEKSGTEYRAEQKRLAEEATKRQEEEKRLADQRAEQDRIAKKQAEAQAKIDEANRKIAQQKDQMKEQALKSIGIYRDGFAGEALRHLDDTFVSKQESINWPSVLKMPDSDFDSLVSLLKAEIQEHKQRRESYKKQAYETALIKAEKDAKEKAEREARENLERDAREIAEEKRQADLKPDKEKLTAWANSLLDTTAPEVADENAKKIAQMALDEIYRVAQDLLQAIHYFK